MMGCFYEITSRRLIFVMKSELFKETMGDNVLPWCCTYKIKDD